MKYGFPNLVPEVILQVVEEGDGIVPVDRVGQEHPEEQSNVAGGENVAVGVDVLVLVVPDGRTAAALVAGVQVTLGELGEGQEGQEDHERGRGPVSH